MDEDVEERYGSVGGRVFLGEFEVFGEGVEERFCVLYVSEGSEAVVNEVGVGMRGSGHEERARDSILARRISASSTMRGEPI